MPIFFEVSIPSVLLIYLIFVFLNLVTNVSHFFIDSEDWTLSFLTCSINLKFVEYICLFPAFRFQCTTDTSPYLLLGIAWPIWCPSFQILSKNSVLLGIYRPPSFLTIFNLKSVNTLWCFNFVAPAIAKFQHYFKNLHNYSYWQWTHMFWYAIIVPSWHYCNWS